MWPKCTIKKLFYFNILLRIFSHKYHIKRTQKGFKSLKIDSFQGLRPWTPLGGLQRPQTPSWLSAGASLPTPPLLADASCNFSITDTHYSPFITKYGITTIQNHWKSISNGPPGPFTAPQLTTVIVHSPLSMMDTFSLKKNLSPVPPTKLSQWATFWKYPLKMSSFGPGKTRAKTNMPLNVAYVFVY